MFTYSIKNIFFIIGIILMITPLVYTVLNPTLMPVLVSILTWIGISLFIIGGLMKISFKK